MLSNFYTLLPVYTGYSSKQSLILAKLQRVSPLFLNHLSFLCFHLMIDKVYISPSQRGRHPWLISHVLCNARNNVPI